MNDKRDAERYRALKKTATAETSTRSSFFWLSVPREITDYSTGKRTTYRSLNGAVDRMIRDSKGKRK